MKLSEFYIKTNNDFESPLYSEFKCLDIHNFVVLDTETTGMNARDEVIELAVVGMDGSVLYDSTFSPTVMVSPGAAAVNHLNNELLYYSPNFADEWQKIKASIGDKTILGHNLAFDKTMVRQTAQRYGINPNESDELFKDYYDSWRIAKKYIDTKSYSLENLSHLLGIKRKETHRACDDCIMTLEFLNRLEYLLKNRQI